MCWALPWPPRCGRVKRLDRFLGHVCNPRLHRPACLDGRPSVSMRPRQLRRKGIGRKRATRGRIRLESAPARVCSDKTRRSGGLILRWGNNIFFPKMCVFQGALFLGRRHSRLFIVKIDALVSTESGSFACDDGVRAGALLALDSSSRARYLPVFFWMLPFAYHSLRHNDWGIRGRFLLDGDHRFCGHSQVQGRQLVDTLALVLCFLDGLGGSGFVGAERRPRWLAVCVLAALQPFL